MRTALLSDIHGNREALAACLAHIQRNPVDRIIFMGDIVGYGADPAWCLDTVMRLCTESHAKAILGNHDEAVFRQDPDMNEAALAAILWTRTKLSENHRFFLETMPTLIEEGEVMFVHASAAQPRDWHYMIKERDADICLRYTDKRIVICGHVHRPQYFHAMDRRPIEAFVPPANVPIPLLRQRRWVLVLGSVGQPRDHNPAAAYSVFDSAQGRIVMHRVAYDIDTAARKIRDAGLPPRLAERLYTGA
jgi:diadenosine tetraphosphatase ApaH/serine/threonine PP2A family protein phosphatase